MDGDHEKVKVVVNSVLFQRILPGVRGSPQGLWVQKAVKLVIQTLEAHMVHSNESWIGHPSIPLRVFGPAKYLYEPPKQLTKPQTTTMPQSDDDNTTFDTQPSSLQAHMPHGMKNSSQSSRKRA